MNTSGQRHVHCVVKSVQVSRSTISILFDICQVQRLRWTSPTMAAWRAGIKGSSDVDIEDAGVQGKPRKSAKQMEGQSAGQEGRDTAETSATIGGSLPPRERRNAVPSSGKAVTSKNVCDEVTKMRNDVSLMKKCILSDHDDIRNLKADLGYWCAVAPRAHPLMVEVLEEGIQYHMMLLGLKEKIDKDDYENTSKEVKEAGAGSAHIFSRVVDYLAEAEIRESETEAKQKMEYIKRLKTQLHQSNPQSLTQTLGTFQVQKSQRTVKLIMNLKIDEPTYDSVRYMMRKVGLKVYAGKPPRDGLHSALQNTLPARGGR